MAILLTTFNARYVHTAFGLRCLLANLGVWRERARWREFDLDTSPLEAAERVLAESPRVVGVGVAIWNVGLVAQLIALLKRLRPELVVVVGGPEVAHAAPDHPAVREADFVVVGEGEEAFRALCQCLLTGGVRPPKVIRAGWPDLATVALPYGEYTDRDVAERVIYLEASRGCPYGCAFCLSALDRRVRRFPLEGVLAAVAGLFARGARQFKWVDRSFNLHPTGAVRILEFFLARMEPGVFLHLEMTPDRLSERIRSVLVRFPAGSLQIEMGVQTFDPLVAARINRVHDPERTEAVLRWLRRETAAHLHTDLILGLPGEDLAGFAAGFDRLAALDPQEIQVGILKRLAGTPIEGLTEAFGMVYNPHPPYDLLCHDRLDFVTMQRCRRFARYWDLVANSGRFGSVMVLLRRRGSLFERFWALSGELYAITGRTHGIALARLQEAVHGALIRLGEDPGEVAAALLADQNRRVVGRSSWRHSRHVTIQPPIFAGAWGGSSPPVG